MALAHMEEGRRGYLVKTLRSEFGEKSPDERKREAAARLELEKRAQAREAKELADQAEEALEAEFNNHRKARTSELIAAQDEAGIAELSKLVAGSLSLRQMVLRWNEIDGNPSRLDKRKKSDVLIFGGYVVPAALALWGTDEDQDFEVYKSNKSVKA